MIQINSNEILIAGKTIKLNYPICEVLEYDLLYVIMLQDDFFPDNNIVAYDKNGNIVWSIEEIIHFPYNEAYVVLGRAGNDLAYVISYSGVRFVFNVYTKEIVEKSITK